MKILMIVPVILTNITGISKETSVLPFESIDISPFYASRESKVVVTTKSSFLSFRLFIQNDKHMNAAVVTGEITSPGTYTYTYSNNYTRTKNRVFIRYSTDGSNYVDSAHADRNIGRAKYGYIENNEGFSSTSTILRIKSDLTYEERPITYSFYGFEGIYVPPYYHKINLSDFKILLNKDDKKFFSCTASLLIKNYNGVFDGIDGSGEYATFDLKLVERSDGFTFALAKDCYVDSKTLKMYSQKQGLTCPKTKYIYLPINEMRNEDKYECYFQFSQFGIDNDLYIHQFQIRSEKNIFGDCSNSKYCIMRDEV